MRRRCCSTIAPPCTRCRFATRCRSPARLLGKSSFLERPPPPASCFLLVVFIHSFTCYYFCGHCCAAIIVTIFSVTILIIIVLSWLPLPSSSLIFPSLLETQTHLPPSPPPFPHPSLSSPTILLLSPSSNPHVYIFPPPLPTPHLPPSCRPFLLSSGLQPPFPRFLLLIFPFLLSACHFL